MDARRQAIAIAVTYVVIAFLWITFSDYAVLLLSEEKAELTTRLQTAKGIFYVLFTGALLYALVFPTLARRQRSEMAALDAGQRLGGLLAAIPHGIQEIDTTGRITFSNPAHARMLGYTPEELVGRPVWELVPPAEQAALRRYIESLIADQPTPETWLGTSLTREGDELYVRVDWSYRHDTEGRLIGITSVLTDVTAEQEHQERQQQVAAVRQCRRSHPDRQPRGNAAARQPRFRKNDRLRGT